MASENRASPETLGLTQALEEAPYKFNFFQAMRLIEAANPGMARLGESTRPSDDPIRLGQEPSLAFAPAMLAAFQPGDEHSADYLAGYFFGLFGPNGPLPLHLSEHARDRERLSRDPTFRAFADIFHHRMMSLFYRAWADSQPTVHMDRPEEDRFAQYVGSTFGMGLESHYHRDALADHSKLYMGGRLALQTKPAEGMQAMLEELFRVPMHVEQYIGEWMALPVESHLLLGDSPQTGSLGITAALGERVWGGQHKFRIQCGPLNGKDFRRFLPGGESLDKLCATVRNYVGDELDWELRLLLLGSEITNTRLAKSGRLGWTSWIGETIADAVVDDVVLHPLDLAIAAE
jgi:type VI secretion system protein ImpH